VVVASKGTVAVGTFAGARSETFLDAILAEDVTARFDDGVLKVAAANRAQCKSLQES
jgi:hypothetical protein